MTVSDIGSVTAGGAGCESCTMPTPISVLQVPGRRATVSSASVGWVDHRWGTEPRSGSVLSRGTKPTDRTLEMQSSISRGCPSRQR